MADILLTNGDISSTVYGDIAVVLSYDEVTQSAIDNILTIYGEDQYHPEIGNMIYGRRVKISDSGLRIVERDCKNAILQDDRINNVLSINATRDANDANNVNVAFVIETIDGVKLSSNIGISI